MKERSVPSTAAALRSLLAAHRDLATVELREFQDGVVGALIWGGIAALAGLTGWLALNAAVIIALLDQPLWAALGVVMLNVLSAVLASLQIRRRLKRPFFALTKREVVRDVGAVFEGLP